MKTYIYKALSGSYRRGYNRTIEVFRVKLNTPEFIGYDNLINTECYRGDYAVACKIISNVDGLKMDGDYKLLSKNVRVLSI